MLRARTFAALAGFASLASLGSAGCSLGELFAGDRVNAENPLWYARPIGAMQVFARRPLTVPGRAQGEEYERGRPEIDPVHGRVFVGSSDRGFYALRTGDASTLWRFETAGMVQSEPLYDAETEQVYFGSNDGALYAVDARTGNLVFRYDTGAEVSKKPVRGKGDALFVANAADFLFALDRRTGKPLWQVKRTSALGMEIAGHAGPAYDRTHDAVLMAFSDGHVAAFGAKDGAERWAPIDLSLEAEASGGDMPRYLDADTTPLLDETAQGTVAYVTSYAGGLFALDARTGTRVWTNDKVVGVTDLTLFRERAHEPHPESDGRRGPQVPERKLLLASSAQTGLMGIDPATGRVLWRNRVPEGGLTAPVQVAGAFVVGSSRFGLFLISPRNGKVIDGLDLGTGFAQTPAAYGGRVYAMSNAGTLLGIAIEPPLTVRDR